MQEFSSVSASSYDPAALAAKLTEKSAEGWSVVSIVPTGGDVTAFLTREATGAGAAASTAADTSSATEATPDAGSSFAPLLGSSAAAAAAPEPAAEPAVAEPAVAEPAGWAVAPEPASPAAEPVSTYQPAAEPVATQPAAEPVSTYQPAAEPVAQAATPSVPAGWYADPAGRFELRYWDGNTWTEHVSRAGQQYTDPPVA